MSAPYAELETIFHIANAVSGFDRSEPNIGYAEPFATDAGGDVVSGPFAFVIPGIYTLNTTAAFEPSFIQDFYFRIHFSPGQINLGNVLTVQTQSLVVWNAYLDSKQLTDYVEPISEGLSVTEPVSPPYTLGALEELNYTITVSTTGPAQFETQISWVIDGTSYEVPINGQRVVVWPFGPNWDRPVYESLEWKTDIIKSFNGSEQRRTLRSKPRRKLGYSILLSGNAVNHFHNLLYGWQNRPFAVPLWHQKSVMETQVSKGQSVIPLDTAGRSYYPGGLGVLMVDNYTFEVFEIEQVNSGDLVATKPLENDWSPFTQVYPMNLARLPASVLTTMVTSKVTTSSVEFMADPVDTQPAFDEIPVSDTLDSREIIYRKPNWVRPVEFNSEFDFELLDHETGGVQQITKSAFPKHVRQFQWLLKNRPEITEFKALIGRLKGRLTPVFIPTWFEDFKLAETAASGSSSLKVVRSQYDSLVGVQETQKYIFIRMLDGNHLIREIIGVSSPSESVEQLSLDTSFPFEINKDNILMISLIHLCRLSQDGVTINYQSDSVSIVEMTFETVKQ